jgi:proline iminopeptidase
MAAPSRPVVPYTTGLPNTADGNPRPPEACGNPVGKPALVTHGGLRPGCGTGPPRILRTTVLNVGCTNMFPGSTPETDPRARSTNLHHCSGIAQQSPNPPYRFLFALPREG